MLVRAFPPYCSFPGKLVAFHLIVGLKIELCAPPYVLVVQSVPRAYDRLFSQIVNFTVEYRDTSKPRSERECLVF